MKIVLSLCMFLSLTLYGASIENVQVDTSGAPSNYVITYDFVPSPGKVAAKAHIDMVLSDNNGETYMFPLQYYYGGQYGNYGIDGDLSGKILEGYESHKINSGLNKKVFFNPMIYIAGSDGCYDSPFVNVSSPQARIRVIASDSEEYTTIPTGLFWYSTFIKNKSRMYLFIKENVLYAVSTNRVYWTIDGKTWQSDMNNNVFGNICTHFSYGNKMWLIDYISGNPIKRIWSSSNGVDWNIVNNNPNYELHGDFIKAQVFKGSVWIPNKDIWYSKDCINWYIATTNKYLYAYGNINNIYVYNDKLWVYNADYADYKFSYTSDGTNWSHYSVEPDPYPFSGSFIEHYNSIWNISDVVKNSPNCINWEKIADSSDLNFDRCYDAISFKNNIFIVGGKHETLTSDMDYIYEIYVTPTLE